MDAPELLPRMDISSDEPAQPAEQDTEQEASQQPLMEEESPAPEKDNDPSLGNIDWSQGGYTIYLISYEDYEMAKAFVKNFSRSLYDVQHLLDIYGAEVQNGIEFRIGLGLFDTFQEADSVMQHLGGRIPGDAWISRIQSARR